MEITVARVNTGEKPTEMISIALPDGSVREVARGTTAAEIAAAIGPGLAKAALAARAPRKAAVQTTASDVLVIGGGVPSGGVLRPPDPGGERALLGQPATLLGNP